jgi:hypothetical protein
MMQGKVVVSGLPLSFVRQRALHFVFEGGCLTWLRYTPCKYH